MSISLETLPKVSVAIVTYNQRDLLREALDSVISQDYANFEVVVADDSSTDGTPEMLREYETRYPGKLRAILGESNEGITVNSNRAFTACTGDYIAWLGGDDLMLQGRITKQVAVMESHPDVAICVSGTEVFESTTNAAIETRFGTYDGQQAYGCDKFIESNNCIVACAVMTRRSVCPPNGFDPRLPTVSDFVFFAETCRDGLVWAQDEVLTRYRKHMSQITATMSRNPDHPDYWLAFQILEEKYPELRQSVQVARAKHTFVCGFTLLRNGRSMDSRVFLRNSFFYEKRIRTLFWLAYSYLPAGFQDWIKVSRKNILSIVGVGKKV